MENSYCISQNKLVINNVTRTFYDGFTNSNQRKPHWKSICNLCIPGISIIKKIGLTQIIYNLQSFIEPRQVLLSDGTYTGFEECEIWEETKIFGHIAQRFSKYEKSGYLNGVYFNGNGIKLFQFIKTTTGWKISSIVWEDM